MFTVYQKTYSRTSYTLPATNMRDKTYTIKNSNPILGENEGMDFLVTGVKTGYTSKAKYTLVSSAHDYTGREVVCVVANMPSRSVSADFSLQLMKKAFDDFAVQSITTAGGIVTDGLEYDPGYAVATAMNIEYLLPRDENTWDIDISSEMFYPVDYQPSRGEIVGRMVYTQDGNEIGSSYLVSANDLATTVPKDIIPVGSVNGLDKAAFPVRFIVPLSLSIAVALLFFFIIRYNKKEVEE